MADYYILNDNGETEATDLMTWAKSFEARDSSRVAETTLPDGRWVSTVFLGIDHSFGFGPPLLFETMVFRERGDGGDLYCERYTSRAEAESGHARIVAQCETGEYAK